MGCAEEEKRNAWLCHDGVKRVAISCRHTCRRLKTDFMFAKLSKVTNVSCVPHRYFAHLPLCSVACACATAAPIGAFFAVRRKVARAGCSLHGVKPFLRSLFPFVERARWFATPARHVCHAGAARLPCRRGTSAVPAWQMIKPILRTERCCVKTVTSLLLSALFH